MSRFAINCPRDVQVLPWDMYTLLVVGNTCNTCLHGFARYKSCILGYHLSWGLAKGTDTVDGKPGRE